MRLNRLLARRLALTLVALASLTAPWASRAQGAGPPAPAAHQAAPLPGPPAAPVQASAQVPVQVLVLGSYHFANPGLDLANVQVDDVLSPQRQAQLHAVVAGLAGFRPTRVVVEARADAWPDAALPRYQAYLAGQLQDDRNEIVQIGFRLARTLGLAQVQGIDVDGDFPFEAVQRWATAQGHADALQRSLGVIQARVRQIGAQHREAGVAQALRALNHPEVIAADHGWYTGLLKYGRGAEQPGAALLASWTARNIAICARLVQLAVPGDRIVLLYGAGHAYLLRQCVQTQPGWRLVEAIDHLPR